MNFTTLNLIYPLLLSYSPAFVNNNWAIVNSEFNKFTPLLFYNQQNIFLKGSKFKNGLNGIILNKNENTEKYFYNTTFDETNFTNLFSNEIKNVENSSISIIDCSFIDMYNLETNSILVKNHNVSLYMSDNIFYNCKSKDGVIRLEECRCVTVTHTCSLKSASKSNYYFYYYDCDKEDFSIFLYSTIVDSVSIEEGQKRDIFDFFCKNGNQYSRCNNFTSSSNGIQYEAPLCFSFAMNTVVDCEYSCFAFSGRYSSCRLFTPKEIQMVNFVSTGNSNDKNSVAIRLSSSCSQTITISNSVLQAHNKIYTYDNDNDKITLKLEHCFVTNDNNNDQFVEFIGCQTIGYDQSQITLYPHYTRGEICKGNPFKDETTKHGCNIGNCIDNKCNYTIGFPSGVPQYKTFIHTDLQSASFTPSHSFTQSSQFSKSTEFSSSKAFTQSKIFTDSDDFDRTSRFTKSNTFSESDSFTKSETFSMSLQFSYSNDPHVNGGGNQDKNDKGNDDKKKIGIIAGSVAAAVAAVGGGLAAFFLIKKRVGVKVEDDPTMGNDKKAGINVENDLDDIMHQDDPFADEFANH